MKKKCSECNNIIGFGGSWEIDGKIVCSKCEKKIRLSKNDTNKDNILKVCEECNKSIGFGGSWEIDGRILCSKCEKKIRLDDDRGKSVEVNIEEKPEILKKNTEKKGEFKYCTECGKKIEGSSKFCGECGYQLFSEKKEMVQYPWLFKGAYAIYHTKSKLGKLPGEFDVTSKLQVEDIDIANKRVKLSSSETIYRTIWRKSKKVLENNLTGWKGIEERVLISDTPFMVQGESESQIRLENLEVRRCIIQQYGVSSSLSTAIVLWDKEFNWPLQYIYIFRHMKKSSPTIAELFVDAVKTSADLMLTFPDWNLQTAIKESKNTVLRENSLVISLKETNIPRLK